MFIINIKTIANRIAKASRAARPSLFDRPTSTRIAQTVRRGFSRVPPTTSSSSLSLSLFRAQRTITSLAPGPKHIRIAAPTDRENLPENRRRRRHSLLSIIIIYYSPVHRKRAATSERRIIHHRSVLEIIQNSGPDEELRLFRPKRRRQDEHEEKKSRQHQQHRDEVRTRYYYVVDRNIVIVTVEFIRARWGCKTVKVSFFVNCFRKRSSNYV